MGFLASIEKSFVEIKCHKDLLDVTACAHGGNRDDRMVFCWIELGTKEFRKGVSKRIRKKRIN